MTSLITKLKRLWPAKIRYQLILGIALVHVVLMTLFVFDLVKRQKHFLKKQNHEQALSLVNNFAVNSTSYIIGNDFDGLERLVQSHQNFPNLKYAMLLSGDGVVLAHTDSKYIGSKPTDSISRSLKAIPQTQILIENNYILDIAVPVLNNKEIVGWARIGLGQEYIFDNLLSITRNGIIYILMALLVGTLFAILIASKLSRGLYKLISATDQIRSGNRNIRVEQFRSFEISKLGTAFNKMLDDISANEKLLAMVQENMPVGLWILDEKGNILSGNQAGKELWGGIEYVGIEGYGLYKGWFADTDKLVEPHEWGAAIAVREGKSVLNQEIEIESFDKTRKTILNSAIPLTDANQQIIGAIVINVDITEKKQAEKNLLKINHNIGERVKELRCLYRMSELSNNPAKSMEDIMQECVDIIPPSYQYPEITTARIIFGSKKFESEKFEESVWKQEKYISAANTNIGLVQVFYTKEMPEEQEGPFLKEERFLINSIADILGSAAERKNAEAVIKEQAETFQAIIENTKESIYLISPEYKLLQFNKTARERILKGRGKELYIGADFREFLYPGTTDIFYSMFEDSLKGNHRNEEIRSQGIHGEYFWFQSKTSPVYGPNGELIGVTLLAEGIDDRKRAEDELKESEEKFRSLVEHSLVGVFIFQEDKFIYANPGFEKLTGYSKEQIQNKITLEDLVHEEDLEMVRTNYLLRTKGQNPPNQYVFRAIRSDGIMLYAEVIVSSIIYNARPAAIGTVIDITGRIEEEKRIGKAVNEAQENERMQIGMELHDNVKQILAASLMSLDHVKSNLNDKKIATEALDNLKIYTKEAINELRRLSHQLAPSIDTEDTLAEKIGKLVDTMNSDERLKVSIDVDEFNNPLHNDIQIAFYRILQEQFNNIVKYAKASTVLVTIKPDKKNIRLAIKDNGKGFDTNTKKDGIGLENIKRRAQVLGGQVKIISSPGNGCEVDVQIPLM